jgi:hypothetical protein
MSLTDAATTAIGRLASRLVRRIVLWSLVGIFGLVALYQASVAAVVALEAMVGAFFAHLIIAAFFAVLAGGIVGFLMFTARRPALKKKYRESLAELPPELQAATIVEALLLGYAMSKKK